MDYAALAAACTTGGVLDVDSLSGALSDAWYVAYCERWGTREVLEVPLRSVVYLFDATSPAGDIDNRLLGVFGRSAPPAGPRDRGRMAGHPSPQRGGAEPVDRGHLVALSMGGGYDINLVPQLASVNRRGRWRAIERYCAGHPGTFFFVHTEYADGSDHPVELHYGWMVGEELRVEVFANARTGAS